MKFLDKFGLPIKYAVYGFAVATFAVAILDLIGWESSQPLALVVGLTAGGAIGGYIKQRRGKNG